MIWTVRKGLTEHDRIVESYHDRLDMIGMKKEKDNMEAVSGDRKLTDKERGKSAKQVISAKRNDCPNNEYRRMNSTIHRYV